MSGFGRWSKTVLGVGICTLTAGGCGLFKKTEPKTAAVETKTAAPVEAAGPDYQKLGPLPKVMEAAALPVLLDNNGVVDVPCFKRKSSLETQSASMEIKADLEKNPAYVNGVMARWILDTVSPPSISEDDTNGWSFKAEYPVMLEYDPLSLRFKDEQECVKESTGWLEEGVRVATVLVGARNFTVTSKKRLTISQQEDLAAALKEQGARMEGEGLDLYKPILNQKGKPKKDAKDQPLYTGPGGIPVPENELPPEGERGVKEWTVKVKEPLYFGYRELPDDRWLKLQQQKECYVFLVWGDSKPRSPECAQFSGVSFTAKELEEGEIKVKVTVGDTDETVKTGYGTTTKLVMDNRVMIWLNLKKEEEGVTVRFNALVIGERFEK